MYCVYKHTTPTGKVYIGITGGNPLARWRGGYGYYKNKHFYSAILKYGWENITHEILFDNLTKEQAEAKEIELIALHQSANREYGYNIDNGGTANGKHSIETLRKMSESQKGRTIPEETRIKMHKPHPTMRGEKNPLYGKPSARRRIIIQYDLQGNYIKQWDYIKQASLEIGIDIGGIVRACNGKQKTAGGYVFKYKE